MRLSVLGSRVKETGHRYYPFFTPHGVCTPHRVPKLSSVNVQSSCFETRFSLNPKALSERVWHSASIAT